jgi:DNA-binding response OmpR family regulator
MTKILVVEDEAHLAAGLRFNLEAEDYQVEVVESGEAALDSLARDGGIDLVLLDVMLPGKDGFEVVSEMRLRGDYTPVLMLTARGRAEDVLQGLEAGADDYIPKPFDLSILLARIKGLLRRKQWFNSSTPQEFRSYSFGRRRIDFEAQSIDSGDGSQQPLTIMEANLLRRLVRDEGKPVARKALLEEVWGVREDTDTRAIDNFIVRLRRYIEDEPSKPRHLQTVRGVGYRFVAEPD